MRRRRTIAARVGASYLAMLLAFALTLGFSVVSAERAAGDAELLRNGYVPLVLSIAGALATQNLVGAQLNHVTEARNPRDLREWMAIERRVRPISFADIRVAVAHGLAPSRDGATRAFGARLARDADELEAYLEEDGVLTDRLFDAISAGDAELAEKRQSELVSFEAEGARRVREMSRRVDRAMDELVGAARARERQAKALLVGLGVATLVVGVLVSLWAARVLRPLAAVTARATDVSRGDLSPRPVVASDDEIGELAATFERMIAAIARANAELVSAERLAAIGKMAAHVTHEIRNPLSSMGLNAELLEEELADDPRGGEPIELVRAIRGEIDRLAALSEQYLSVARRPAPKLEREDLAALVREMAEFVRPELERAGVTLELSLAADGGDASVDEAQLRQAWLNLVRNAREAMQPTGGVLAVSLSRVADRVELTVDDAGAGIPDELRDKIFDPFFTTKERGTGLGLALTRQIVEAHGGTISCEPRAPRGTRMRVVLPAAPR